MLARTRGRIYSLLCKWPRICNASAYFVVCRGSRENPFITSLCYRDRDESGDGVCWCGKLKSGPLRPTLIDGDDRG